MHPLRENVFFLKSKASHNQFEQLETKPNLVTFFCFMFVVKAQDSMIADGYFAATENVESRINRE